MRRAFPALLVAALGLAAVVIVRAWRFRPDARPPADRRAADVDTSRAAEHLGAAIRFPTVSRDDGAVAAEALAGLGAWLQGTYPAAAVLEHVRRAVDDTRVQVRNAGSREASRESRAAGPAWQRLAAAARRAFPDAVVAPALVLGGTDSRHFQDVSAETYRFAPLPAGPDDLPRIHGRDERVAVADLGPAVAFYLDYLRETGR